MAEYRGQGLELEDGRLKQTATKEKGTGCRRDMLRR